MFLVLSNLCHGQKVHSLSQSILNRVIEGIEDCEVWWLSGCRSLAADLEHWLRQARCPGFDSQ